MRYKTDDIDVWCTDWARQRRIALGILDTKLHGPAIDYQNRIRAINKNLIELELMANRDLAPPVLLELQTQIAELQSEKLRVVAKIERLDNCAGILPQERLGQLRSTLGKVRSEKEGASYSRVNQNFPEVYLGMALTVHQGYWQMTGEQRIVMHLHYVWKEISVKDKAPEVPTSPTQYWVTVDCFKSFLRGYIAANRPSKLTGEFPALNYA